MIGNNNEFSETLKPNGKSEEGLIIETFFRVVGATEHGHAGRELLGRQFGFASRRAIRAGRSFRRLAVEGFARRERPGEQRVKQAPPGGGGGGEARVQPVAKLHQRIDLPATMRCCSASSGRGTRTARSLSREMFI